jgi:hypothetical protein
MTVCIANVAASSKAIVMVSDKAITYGDTDIDSVRLVSDTEAQKVLRIGHTFWYALIAGEPTFAFDVVEAAAKMIAKKPDWKIENRVESMMYCLKSAYQKCRDALPCVKGIILHLHKLAPSVRPFWQVDE